jgi:hypothetical protein
MTTVCTYSANGPYFPPAIMRYQAASLKDLLMHVGMAKEDGEDVIAVFDGEGRCKGVWENDAEPVSDGEGGWGWPAPAYRLLREGKDFDMLVALF